MISATVGFGQVTYIGAGIDNDITVAASSNSLNTSAVNTINGEGLDARAMEAARFLSQATFGQNMEQIIALANNLDYEAWIDNEFTKLPEFYLPRLDEIAVKSRQIHEEENPGEDFFGPYALHFNYTWWDVNKKSTDFLRHRIAYALSQILVVSANSDLRDHGEAMASFYDVLYKHAFGNYKNLLLEVSLHPAMGHYLSHLSNPKTNTERNIHPDENYAREIMQLFTIGLYELNIDGTRKTENNEWIPTYDNNDIKELAKVFTGLGGGGLEDKVIEEYPDAKVDFNSDFYVIDKTVPMSMYPSQHEPGEKTIIGNYVISSGQTGMKDIDQAVTHIFNHPNVGPFVAFRLIQQLVKSNPSPPYVERVAQVFNDNGNGERGSMKEVIKAILLDEEARSCTSVMDPTGGKLREPMLRQSHVLHAFDTDSPTGDYWNNAFDYWEDTKQAALAAPSVFNFYLPDHQPVGGFVDQGLFGPEFKIHDSQTSVGYFNQVSKWTDWDVFSWDWHESTPNVNFVWDSLEELAEDPEDLLNYLDIILTHGQLSDETRRIITKAMTQLSPGGYPYLYLRVKMAIYLVLVSPDYVILK